MGCKDSKPEQDAAPGWAQFREGSFEITIEEEDAHAKARDQRGRVHLEKVPDFESKLQVYQGIWADIKAARAARDSWQHTPTAASVPDPQTAFLAGTGTSAAETSQHSLVCQSFRNTASATQLPMQCPVISARHRQVLP